MSCAVRVLATTAKGQRRLEILGCGAPTVEVGWKAQRRNPPPPAAAKCRTPCLRRACVVPATCVQRRDDDKGAPPPHTSAPPDVRTQGRRGDNG